MNTYKSAENRQVTGASRNSGFLYLEYYFNLSKKCNHFFLLPGPTHIKFQEDPVVQFGVKSTKKPELFKIQ